MQVLGGFAVLAFLGVAIYIGMTLLQDGAKRCDTVGKSSLSAADYMKKDSVATVVSGKSSKELAVERYEEECRNFLDEMLDSAASRMAEFAKAASCAYQKLADSYAKNSYGMEGETSSVRSSKFIAVCDRQWGFMRGEIGYLLFLDIQEQLRHILDNHRMLDRKKPPEDDGSIDLSPELLRSQEIVSLARAVGKDKVSLLQRGFLDTIEEFRTFCDRGTLQWLNERLVALTSRLSGKSRSGIRLSDTNLYDEFKQFKARLEIVARFTDRVANNTQPIGEDSLALSQIIYVGTVLSILANLPEWFSELNAVDEGDDLGNGAVETIPA